MIKSPGLVILILGPKHSGKTSAGKALARLCPAAVFPPDLVRDRGGVFAGSAEFIDLDELVERRAGKSPRLLYREGPEIFRGAEAEALRALLEGELWGGGGNPGGITIAAAGGGLADNGEALEILKKPRSASTVYTVYIEIPAETAWKRIRAAADESGELPPFLDTENPRETHRLLHRRRGAVYRELAKITVKAGNTPEETAAKILRRLTDVPPEGGFQPVCPDGFSGRQNLQTTEQPALRIDIK
ncbi:MAG: shikimate kinase [Treponema sp.]|jgi:shikimate kinase|nr:shikimate kinase [Treponema sp.]